MMLSVFRNMIPEFDSIEKKCFITHADVDHCGLLPFFDTVYASAKTVECNATGLTRMAAPFDVEMFSKGLFFLGFKNDRKVLP